MYILKCEVYNNIIIMHQCYYVGTNLQCDGVHKGTCRGNSFYFCTGTIVIVVISISWVVSTSDNSQVTIDDVFTIHFNSCVIIYNCDHMYLIIIKYHKAWYILCCLKFSWTKSFSVCWNSAEKFIFVIKIWRLVTIHIFSILSIMSFSFYALWMDIIE